VSPRPGGDVSNSSEFAVIGSGEWKADGTRKQTARAVGAGFVRQHPALSLALVYLAVTVVGRLDDLWFFQVFKINIFYYSSPEDFFLAPLKNPIALLFLLVPALVIVVFAWVRDSRAKSGAARTRHSRFLDEIWYNPAARLALGGLLVVAIAATLTQNHATRRSSAVKAGVGRRVSFERNDGMKFSEQPLLLGSTGKFFFLYYPNRKVTEIVPVENTALMTIDSRGRPDSSVDGPSGGGARVPTSSLSP